MAGLALVEAGLAAPAQLRTLQPVEREQGAFNPSNLSESEVQTVLAFERATAK